MKREKLRKILRGKCISDESCEAAIEEILNLHIVSESLQVGTFLLQKVTKNDYNNSDNIVFLSNEEGEGTDINLEEVFQEKM